MIRARFYANFDDYRPICWPVKHPFWCSGYTDTCSIVVTYADNVEEILNLWPEAQNIDSEERDGYLFSDRFQQPEWFVVPEGIKVEYLRCSPPVNKCSTCSNPIDENI